MVCAVTIASAAFLVLKTIWVVISNTRCLQESATTASIVEGQEGNVKDTGKLRRLIESLGEEKDAFERRMKLYAITTCAYLLTSETASCPDDLIDLVASMLQDEEKGIKIQVLNTLRAFAKHKTKREKMQEYVPPVTELMTSVWDSELHVATLKLLNKLPLRSSCFPLLRKSIPCIMKILQSQCSQAQIEAARLLIRLSRKEELLYDVLNCQVFPDFLNLFNTSLPADMTREMLHLLQTLCAGCSSPIYQALSWTYNDDSLCEALFGEVSHLADNLLSLIMHTDEDVQIEVSKIIVTLQHSKSLRAFQLRRDSSATSTSLLPTAPNNCS
ncbi:hypothetical protein FKM82_016667 [Ascaphus truei]